MGGDEERTQEETRREETGRDEKRRGGWTIIERQRTRYGNRGRIELKRREEDAMPDHKKKRRVEMPIRACEKTRRKTENDETLKLRCEKGNDEANRNKDAIR